MWHSRISQITTILRQLNAYGEKALITAARFAADFCDALSPGLLWLKRVS